MGQTIPQSKVGSALELAGALLRQGEVAKARRVLWAVRHSLQVLMILEPKTDQSPEKPPSAEAESPPV